MSKRREQERQRFEDRKTEVFGWVERFIDQFGFSPTIREVAAGMDLTVDTTHRALIGLRSDGRLTWEENQGRTMRPVTEND